MVKLFVKIVAHDLLTSCSGSDQGISDVPVNLSLD